MANSVEFVNDWNTTSFPAKLIDIPENTSLQECPIDDEKYSEWGGGLAIMHLGSTSITPTLIRKKAIRVNTMRYIRPYGDIDNEEYPEWGGELVSMPLGDTSSTPDLIDKKAIRVSTMRHIRPYSFLIAEKKERSEFDKVSGTLISYLNLPVGWDGYDGVPPSIESVQACLKLLKKVNDLKIKKLPKSMLTGSGEVSLYCTDKVNNTHIEICAEEGALFTYLVVSKNETLGEDYVDLLTSFPNKLKSYLLNVLNS